VSTPYITGRADWLRNDTFVLSAAGVSVALAASAFYSPLPLVIVIGIPFLLYCLSRPYELLLVMVFLIPFNFVFTIGTVPVAIELLKVFAWIPFLLTRRQRSEFIGSRFNKWFAVLAGIILLSLIRANDFPFTVKESVRLASNLGLVYLALNLVDSREKLFQLLRVLTVSTFLVACYGFYQWAIQGYGALFWIVNPRLNTSLAHYRDDFWPWRNRIISVLTSEMELGHYFNLCLPVGVMLWLTEGRRRVGSKWLLMTFAMLAGLVLTFTFGAWLALAATFALFVLTLAGKARWKLLLAGVVILSLLVALVAYGPLRPIVVAKATGTAIGSLTWDIVTRLIGWKLAMQTWLSHPLLGVGIGNYEVTSAGYDYVLGPQSQGSSPHETYLYLLASIGLVGTLSVLVIMVSTLRSNLQDVGVDPDLRLLKLALAFALATNLIGWFGDDSGFYGPHAGYLLWLFVGLSEAIPRIAERPLTPFRAGPNPASS
jgi:O-antigen ligase/polysaccharide polymerase Wzy-like membrane protein